MYYTPTTPEEAKSKHLWMLDDLHGTYTDARKLGAQLPCRLPFPMIPLVDFTKSYDWLFYVKTIQVIAATPR